MLPSTFMSLLVIAGRIYQIKHRPVQRFARETLTLCNDAQSIDRFCFETKCIKNKFIGNACSKMHEANSNSNLTHVIPSALERLIAQSCTEIPQVSITTFHVALNIFINNK